MRKVLSFEQEWTREVPDRPNILRYMRKAIGVNEVQWDDINARASAQGVRNPVLVSRDPVIFKPWDV